MKNIFYILIILFLLISKSYAGSGDATEYKITIKKVELCASGSAVSECINPITIFSGNSGPVDIANTAAGQQAAALGNAGAAVVGTTYTVVQTTMDREITVSGYYATGNDSCSTIASNGSDADKNGKGDHATGGTPDTPVAGVYYAGEADNSDLDAGDAWNGIDANGDVNTTDDKNDGDFEDFQWRNALESPVTITLGRLPTIKIAFGTGNTIGFAGNIATAAHCTNDANATTGIYVMNPDVSISIIN